MHLHQTSTFCHLYRTWFYLLFVIFAGAAFLRRCSNSVSDRSVLCPGTYVFFLGAVSSARSTNTMGGARSVRRNNARISGIRGCVYGTSKFDIRCLYAPPKVELKTSSPRTRLTAASIHPPPTIAGAPRPTCGPECPSALMLQCSDAFRERHNSAIRSHQLV